MEFNNSILNYFVLTIAVSSILASGTVLKCYVCPHGCEKPVGYLRECKEDKAQNQTGAFCYSYELNRTAIDDGGDDEHSESKFQWPVRLCNYTSKWSNLQIHNCTGPDGVPKNCTSNIPLPESPAHYNFKYCSNYSGCNGCEKSTGLSFCSEAGPTVGSKNQFQVICGVCVILFVYKLF